MNTTLDILSFLFVVTLVASFVFAFLGTAADEQHRERDVITYNICTYACFATLIALTFIAQYTIQ